MAAVESLVTGVNPRRTRSWCQRKREVAGTQMSQNLVNGRSLSAFANVRARVVADQLSKPPTASMGESVSVEMATSRWAFASSYSADAYIRSTHHVWVATPAIPVSNPIPI